MNIIGILVIFFASNLWLGAIFDLTVADKVATNILTNTASTTLSTSSAFNATIF